MNRRIAAALTAAFLSLLLARVARAADIAVDPNHTSATFSVKHLTLTTVSGKVPIKSATLGIAADDTLTSVKTALDVTGIDTGNAQRDGDLRSERWFDVAKYPVMTFTSTKITGSKDAMTVAGDLSFNGVTSPISLAAKFEGSVKDERGRTHLGYTATGTIDRTTWKLGANFPAVVVGNDVTITIQAEVVEP